MANKSEFPTPTKEGLDPYNIPFVEEYLKLNGIELPLYEPEFDIPEGLDIGSCMAMRMAGQQGEPAFALAFDYGVKEAVVDDVLEYRKARHAGGPAVHAGIAFGLSKRIYYSVPHLKAFARGVASFAKKLLPLDLYTVFMEVHGHTPATMSELEQENFVEFTNSPEAEQFRDLIRGGGASPTTKRTNQRAKYRRLSNALVRPDV